MSTPDWTDQNESDPGITILTVFVFVIVAALGLFVGLAIRKLLRRLSVPPDTHRHQRFSRRIVVPTNSSSTPNRPTNRRRRPSSTNRSMNRS